DTRMVCPSALRAARCAAASMPYAPPETMSNPRAARPYDSSVVTCSPYAVAAREPTIAAPRTAAAARSAGPFTHHPSGGPGAPPPAGWGGPGGKGGRRTSHARLERRQRKRRPPRRLGHDQSHAGAGARLEISLGIGGRSARRRGSRDLVRYVTA